jgi:hypothetical protein
MEQSIVHVDTFVREESHDDKAQTDTNDATRERERERERRREARLVLLYASLFYGW